MSPRIALVTLIAAVVGSSGCMFFVDTQGCTKDSDCAPNFCNANGFCEAYKGSGSGSSAASTTSSTGSTSGSTQGSTSSSTGSSTQSSTSSGSTGTSTQGSSSGSSATSSSSGSTGNATSSSTTTGGVAAYNYVHLVAGDRVGGARNGQLTPTPGLATVNVLQAVTPSPGADPSVFYFIDYKCIRWVQLGSMVGTLNCSNWIDGPISPDGGDIDGPIATATFAYPFWLAFDDQQRLLVWDQNGLRRISSPFIRSSATVETLIPFGDLADGGYFQLGPGVHSLNRNEVYALNGNEIDLLEDDGGLSAFAGSQTPGYSDTAPLSSLFDGPTGLAADPSGTLYVLDQQGTKLRSITPVQVGTITDVDAGVYPGMAFGANKVFFNTSAFSNQPTLLSIDVYNGDLLTGAVIDPSLLPQGTALGVNGAGQAVVGAQYRLLASDDGGSFYPVAGNGMNGVTDGNVPGSDAHAEFRFIQGLGVNVDSNVLVAGGSGLTIFNLLGGTTSSIDAGLNNAYGAIALADDQRAFLVPHAFAGWGVLQISGGTVSDLIPVLPNSSSTSDPGDGNVYDGGAKVSAIDGILSDGHGGYYLSDTLSHRIRHFDPSTGQLTTVAGTGVGGYGEGPALLAEFNRPRGIATADGGLFYIADSYNGRIRVYNPTMQLVGTYAGPVTLPDGGLSQPLYNVQTLAFGPDGVLYAQTTTTISRVYADGGVDTFFFNHNVEDGQPINSPQPTLFQAYGLDQLTFGPDGDLYFGNDTEVRKLSAQ